METTQAAPAAKNQGTRLLDRVAIITGGAQGIGLATAEVFLSQGARVVLVDIDEGALQKAAQDLSAGDRVMGLKVNVTSFPECEAAVKQVVERFGRLDILVNNAGITRDNLIMRMSDNDWDLVINVNLKGPFNFIKAACRPMMKAHYGRIVNVASVVGQEGNAGQANYAASKGGLIALTKAAARELASRNILVNAISPGFIRTRLTETLPQEAKDYLLNKILVGREGAKGRPGEPAEIGRAILFLCSEDSSYITGHVLAVNGGGYT